MSSLAMARTLVPRHDVVVRVPVVATGGPVPVTDPEDDLPPPWKAALPVPVDAHASVSAAEWNSLLVWARAQRGPQWDAATGMCVLGDLIFVYANLILTLCQVARRPLFGRVLRIQ